MGNCKFSYYKKGLNLERNYLYCTKTSEICTLVKFCNTLNKIISTDNYKICKEYDKMKIPSGKNKVRFEKNGKLIVELYNKNGETESCIEVINPFEEFPQFVELIKIKDIYYVKGYEPKTVIKNKQIPKQKRQE